MVYPVDEVKCTVYLCSWCVNIQRRSAVLYSNMTTLLSKSTHVGCTIYFFFCFNFIYILLHVDLDSKRGERGNSTGKQMEQPVSVASETNMGATNNVSSGAKPPVDLEMMFFDLEVTMEDNLLCRDVVCTQKDSERRE